MDEAIKNLLKKELMKKYGGNIVENNNIFVIKEASKPNAPFIPEEMDKIINNIGTIMPLRTGQVAYTLHNKDLIVQLST